MTIGSWLIFGFIVLMIAIGAFALITMNDFNAGGIGIVIIVAVALCVGAYSGLHWYQHNTATGIRELTDQKAELNNGLEREINVYTADGSLIAHYEGKIDLEDNEGGYVLFEYEGKRYTYYNCFVESIANID